MNEVIILVDRELQAAYDHFLRLLKNDIARHMGNDEDLKPIPFIIKTTFELGTQEQHAGRLLGYHKILQKMCDDSPNRMGTGVR